MSANSLRPILMLASISIFSTAAASANTPLRERYSGTYEGEVINVRFDSQRLRIKDVIGGLKFDFSDLPAMRWKSSSTLETEGEYDSFTCTVRGLGYATDPSDGSKYLSYGVTDRYSVPLNARTGMMFFPSGLIYFYVSYEVMAENNCKKENRYAGVYVTYFPPTEGEIEAARIANNTNQIKTALSKDDFVAVAELLKQGIDSNEYSNVARQALRKKQFVIAEDAIKNVPTTITMTDLVFDAIETEDSDLLAKFLASEPFKRHVNFKSIRKNHNAVGYVIRALYTTGRNSQQFTVTALDLLLAAGASVTDPISNSDQAFNYAIHAAVYRSHQSPALIRTILKSLPAEAIDKPARNQRATIDYLSFAWNLVKDKCKPNESDSAEMKAHYNHTIADFNDVFDQLVAKGSKGKRLGCIYYKEATCTYTKENFFEFKLHTYLNTTKWPGVSDKCG